MAETSFSLSSNKRHSGPVRQHRTQSYTKSEISDKLRGYVKIDHMYWKFITHNTHVRYVTKDGAFKPGGFVVRNPFMYTSQETGKEKTSIKLQNGFDPKLDNYASWLVDYDSIADIFAKGDAVALTTLSSINLTINETATSLDAISEHIAALDQRIERLEKSIGASSI